MIRITQEDKTPKREIKDKAKFNGVTMNKTHFFVIFCQISYQKLIGPMRASEDVQQSLNQCRKIKSIRTYCGTSAKSTLSAKKMSTLFRIIDEDQLYSISSYYRYFDSTANFTPKDRHFRMVIG